MRSWVRSVLTEPGAGTDAQGQQTKAVLDGDEWVLNGSKCFITNGKEADVYVIFAVTGVVEKRGRKMKEISAFIVEKGTPGLHIRYQREEDGYPWIFHIRADLHRIAVSRRKTCWVSRARASTSLCILWMAAVSVSLLRLWVLQRALLREPLHM